jgi:hypothetical protein
MMVVIPIHAEHGEAQSIGKKYRDEGTQRVYVCAAGDSELQDHNGDEDRNYAITERLETGFAHSPFRHSPSAVPL